MVKKLTKRFLKKSRVKKGKKITTTKRLITGFEKALEFKLPAEKKLTREQIGKKLLGRKEQTLQKIIQSPNSSPIAKIRARRLLGI